MNQNPNQIKNIVFLITELTGPIILLIICPAILILLTFFSPPQKENIVKDAFFFFFGAGSGMTGLSNNHKEKEKIEE